jgi:hypothetical protein
LRDMPSITSTRMIGIPICWLMKDYQLFSTLRTVWELLYGGMCSSSWACGGVCGGGTIVSCNETCHTNIRWFND